MPLLSLAAAAALLGVSPDTLRRRIRRGDVAAQRDARGRYLVDVPAAAYAPTEAAPDERLGMPTQPSAADARLLQQVQSENTYLRQALEREQVASAELRRLLAMHVPALPAPAQPVTTAPRMDATPAVGTSTTTNTPRRVGWRFWRRR